jgi:hypothetical protein
VIDAGEFRGRLTERGDRQTNVSRHEDVGRQVRVDVTGWREDYPSAEKLQFFGARPSSAARRPLFPTPHPPSRATATTA